MKIKISLFDWCNYLFWIFSLLIILGTDKLALHLFFNSFNSRLGDFIMPLLTYVGDGLFLCLTCLFIFLFQSKKLSIILLVGFLLSTGLVQLLKHLVFENHMRPIFVFQHIKSFHEIKGFNYHSTYSFPSGHATSSFVLFTFIAMNFAKTNVTQIICFFSALFFAYTRVYLSQHYFEDLFAGAIIGFLCMKLTQIFLAHFRQNMDNPLNT